MWQEAVLLNGHRKCRSSKDSEKVFGRRLRSVAVMLVEMDVLRWIRQSEVVLEVFFWGCQVKGNTSLVYPCELSACGPQNTSEGKLTYILFNYYSTMFMFRIQDVFRCSVFLLLL